MVGIEEGTYKLFGLLYCLIDFNPLLCQVQGVNHEGNLFNYISIAVIILQKLIKTFLVLLGDHIPDLPLTCMVVIK